MKFWTLVCLFLANSAFAADDMILVSDVTEETYDAFMNQYTESCRPHVLRWVGAASLAASKFNDGSYYEASQIIERHVKPGDFKRRTGSAAIMFSDDCSLEDLILTMAQSDALLPMIESSQCMVRVADSDRAWSNARERLTDAGKNPSTEDLRGVLQLVHSAVFAIDDVIEDDPNGGACRHLDPKYLTGIQESRLEYISVQETLSNLLEEEESNDVK